MMEGLELTLTVSRLTVCVLGSIIHRELDLCLLARCHQMILFTPRRNIWWRRYYGYQSLITVSCDWSVAV